MNRILLITTLLLTAGFSGQVAYAAPTYTPSTAIVSPTNGGKYNSTWPALPQVPYSVVNQFVRVTGGTSYSVISIKWSMIDQAEGVLIGNNTGNVSLDQDISNGPTVEMITKDGTFTRYLNGGSTGVDSGTLSIDPRVGGSAGYHAFDSWTGITDIDGNVYSTSQSSVFTVVSYS